MSAEPLSLACKLEDLKQLDNKPFNKYPRGYQQAVKKRLTPAEYSTFVELKEESFKNYKNGGLVIQSAYETAKRINRSSRTVERHLSSIKAKGFIDFESLKSGRGIYRRNCIKLTCPKDVLEEILSGSKDIIKPSQKHSTGYLCPTKMSGYSDKNAEHSFNNRNIDKSDIKTNIREESLLDNLEPVDEALEYPLEYQLQNESVEQNVPRETFLEEPQGEVARFITKAERKQIVTKVKAMKRDGEIHPKVQANYQDIMVLVQHIIIHCVYRNVLRYKNFKHALNSAADGLRNGTWTTPKRVLREETLERERLHNEAKEKEKQLILSSGIGRSLGNALRAQNGPSEVDLARVKAGILEQGIRELGPNPRKQDIDKLKAIIQKTVEDKWKERK